MAEKFNEEMLAELVRQVLKEMSSQESEKKTGAPYKVQVEECQGLTVEDYPLGTKRPDIIKSPRGNAFNDLTLDAVLQGKATFEDFRIAADALLMQAQIAESAGRSQIATNLKRAAELTKVPDERILEIYNAMRPHRSTKEELLAIADELENKHGATTCATFVREAVSVYERRKLFRGDVPE
ncbi:diol dehydratase small subunit [Acetomicrobium sp.]|uniref:diol dehydratase small subunit n=1 Tax=Acetomicrobium sp. TaxID=1872099 RepID=UPI002871CA50|nr:diol dehydratase small subunit [Acetomicrobium sp.]MDR9771051.1 diol dehydratase small subunit [Acetomicrobium sp.]